MRRADYECGKAKELTGTKDVAISRFAQFRGLRDEGTDRPTNQRTYRCAETYAISAIGLRMDHTSYIVLPRCLMMNDDHSMILMNNQSKSN